MNSRQALRTALLGARKSARLTQAQLALRLDRPQSFVSKYESGGRRLDVVELIEIAACLGVDVPALIRRLSRSHRSNGREMSRARAAPHRRIRALDPA